MLISKWKKDYKTGKFFEDEDNTDIKRLKLRIRELERLVGQLTMENRLLKRARNINNKEKKRRFINNNLKELKTIKRGCRLVGLSRSSYYYESKKDRSSDLELADRINDIALKYPYYGYRRVTAELKRQNIVINHKKVYRIMRDKNILCKIKRSFKKTTNSAHSYKKYPNLIKNMIPQRINEIWNADITYIRILTSFVYLAIVIDAYSRKIVGYGLGKTLSADLTIAALKDAISKRDVSDLIHHSDQGIQYCSSDYVNILNENHIKISMSDKASPYENSIIESFFRTLKVEEVYMFNYETYEDVIERIAYFIEEVYNKKRLHSSLGYMPPEEFESVVKNNKIKGNESRQLVLT
jgi:transposase InsO family protein